MFGNPIIKDKVEFVHPDDLVIDFVQMFGNMTRETFVELAKEIPILKTFSPYVPETMANFHIKLAPDAPKVIIVGTTSIKVTYELDGFIKDNIITLLNIQK